MRRIRVALLATSVNFGGIERVLLNLSQHMDGGVELVPIVFTRTDTKERSFFDRLEALGLPCQRLFVDAIQPDTLNLLVNPLLNLAQLAKSVRKRGIDVIHSHGYRADLFALATSKLCGLPAVSTVHGLIGTDRRLRLYNALDRSALKWFTRVIAVSAPIKDDLVLHGVPSDRIEVVPNAVTDISEGVAENTRREIRYKAGASSEDVVFGYVGRLSGEKGVHHLIDAAGRLAATRPNMRLLVVGDGPDRGALELVAGRAALAGKVTFVGFQSDPTPWYSAMDAFVLPSLMEGTPMALLETMAAGIPAIATRVGGVPAVISDGDTGVLVEPGDVDHLHQAMATLFDDPRLRQKLARAGCESIKQRYSVQSWIQSIVGVYDSAVRVRTRMSDVIGRAQAK